MAATLYMTSGISGSGKSRFTSFVLDALKAKEVNADNIRAQMGNISDQSKNEEVFHRLNDEVNKFLAGGVNVIISNTNLHYFSIVDYCKKYPLNDVVLFVMMDSSNPELCKSRIHKDIESGIARSNVPDEVVDKQFKNFNYLLDDLKNKARPANLTVCQVDTNLAIYNKL